ncbi:amidase family protein [Bacillus wiedmannii]|uniref:amidase family protein n=1 Tax=Bacillus wiedmannii TaxID=1890302 RepID=UPI0024AD98DE|nr:amidase family protein [Bacillus wiedmannii]MDI6674583.1 amidase family protein [Bacillus wiedmannii]
MKKWVKVTLSIAGGIVLLACAGGYYVYKNYFPKEPERIVYDKDRVLKPIHNQLKGINIENVKIKEKEVVNATVDELQKMIDDGKLSYEELTSIYLFRIQEHDQNGISLNAVTEINPNAMEEARKLDKERSFNKKSNLYGMPVIVKDNVQTVKDAATLFNIMVSFDEKDAMTEKMKDKERIDYTKDLSIDRQDENRKEVAEKIRKDLQDAGAILTDDIQLNAEGVDNLQTLEYEFKHNVNDYLSKQKNVPVKSLEEIITFNKKDSNRRIKYGQTLIEGSEKSAITKDEVQKVVQTSQENTRKGLDRYLVEKGLDALVMISNDEVLLSAVAGYPELAVPAGYDNNGEPVGAVFVGRQFGEKDLFNIGYAYEQQSKNRRSPKL